MPDGQARALDLAAIDLVTLAEALEDHSTEWWFDPATGDLEPRSDMFGDELGEGHPAERGLRHVEPLPSHEAYSDMEDFIAGVGDARARDLLERAISGRGAFRRFKDTLFEFPELRETWFELKNARMTRRALQWLADEGLVDEEAAERAAVEHRDPAPPSTANDVAGEAARELRALYGERLQRVVLFGSRARGDADPESDLDLLVVLEDMRSSWTERARMDGLLWRVSQAHGVVVSAVPVRAHDVTEPHRPALVRALAEGIELA
jgi:predicted nucleotidyltransferase